MTAELKSTSQGRTMVLTISNPEMRNALAPQIYAAGIEALNVAEGNPDLRSVVIVGEGAVFCSGGDLRRILARRQQPPEAQAQAVESLHSWIEAIRTFPKPVIAAVEGAAVGAGFGLALACDFIVAARDAQFVMAYSRVALTPDGGSSWSLARALPRQLATELLMCGQHIGSQRLHELGVVNRLTDAGQALECALQLAENLNAQAPNVMAGIKELLNDADQNSLNAQLAAERDHFVRNLHHVNGGIGINAFLDKKKPEYR